jgi:hypothetical protein
LAAQHGFFVGCDFDRQHAPDCAIARREQQQLPSIHDGKTIRTASIALMMRLAKKPDRMGVKPG